MKKNVLASYAVFSILKDNSKSVYDVIEVFIASYLQKAKVYNFSLSEIVVNINNEFNFKLPTAVIRKSLKHMKGIIENDEDYSVDFSKIKKIDVSQIQESEQYMKQLLTLIYSYIETRLEKKLSDEEKQEIISEFIKYLLNSKCSDLYMKFFATFLLENENNEFVVKYTNEIKEGSIIYVGITTDLQVDDNNIDNLGIFKHKMIIYLDTEILYHYYGLNGKYFKQQAMDFFNLVKEINKKERYIEFRYFADVKREIHDYYRAAEEVVRDGILKKKECAMAEIIKGCSSPSDIINKRTKFFTFLKNNHIEEDEIDSYYTNEENYKYNIEGGEEVHPYLNYINILRKGHNSGKLINIGYILITGKSILLSQSWEKYWKEKDIPRATTLDYLTEHFWFILNKGFGSNSTLKSFDTIAKAKTILSSLIASNISSKYDDINQRMDSGEISFEDAVDFVAGLREEARKPDDITAKDSNYILSILSESDIKKQIEEKRYKEAQLHTALKKNYEMESEMEKKDLDLISTQKELEKYKKQDEKRKRRNRWIIRISLVLISILFLICYFKYLNKPLLNWLNSKYTKTKSDLGNLFGLLGFLGINLSNIKSLIKFIGKKIKSRKL